MISSHVRRLCRTQRFVYTPDIWRAHDQASGTCFYYHRWHGVPLSDRLMCVPGLEADVWGGYLRRIQGGSLFCLC